MTKIICNDIMKPTKRKVKFSMEFFNTYTSNTVAGSGSQSFFENENENEIQTSRTFYKVFSGGEYTYSFLFSNILDSTFADGSHSHKNMIIDAWTIVDAKVGISKACSENSFEEPYVTYALTFDKKQTKTVNPGEFFSTDPVRLAPKKDEYICIEMSFKGKFIPYHPESIIPSFVLSDGEWTPSKLHPFAGMIGCDRPVEKKIGFLGDSITQGIGTAVNSYAHWNSVVAQNLGEQYAYWNLGLGFGRADDAASDGAWLYKAKQNDIVFVCYGVNDILQGFAEETIKKNLEAIVNTLTKSGVRVILQTIPPFDYSGELINIWNNVNDFIKNTLSDKVDLVFDCVKYLQKSENEPHMAGYGGHPDEVGCKIWGENLYRAIKEVL